MVSKKNNIPAWAEHLKKTMPLVGALVWCTGLGAQQVGQLTGKEQLKSVHTPMGAVSTGDVLSVSGSDCTALSGEYEIGQSSALRQGVEFEHSWLGKKIPVQQGRWANLNRLKIAVSGVHMVLQVWDQRAQRALPVWWTRAPACGKKQDATALAIVPMNVCEDAQTQAYTVVLYEGKDYGCIGGRISNGVQGLGAQTMQRFGSDLAWMWDQKIMSSWCSKTLSWCINESKSVVPSGKRESVGVSVFRYVPSP